MRHRRITVVAAVALAAMVAVPLAQAADSYAVAVYDFARGPYYGSQPSTAYQSPAQALGAPDSTYLNYTTFTALGEGGVLILDMGVPFAGHIRVIETTFGPYAAETANVYVSGDGSNWTSIGVASSGRPASTAVQNPTVLDAGSGCFRYVKLVDTSPVQASFNGFDVDAVAILNDVVPVCEIDVDIDIKPGSYPNAININGNGVIPVAILGSADFDVADINTSTLLFGGLSVRTKGNGGAQCSINDVSGDFTYPEGAPDGYDDLVCQFVDSDGVIFEGNGTAEVDGFLYDGTPFHGEDTIKLVNE